MASPMPVNALLRPTQDPATRWAPGIPAMPRRQLPIGALRVPQPNALMAPQGPPPMMPQQAAAPPLDFSPVPEDQRISARVPVPKADFPEGEHQDLHDKTMGEAFDEPGAHEFVRRLYATVRKTHPDVHPRHLLETTRDAYHAMRHGFMTPQQAGGMLGRIARRRQAAAYAQPEPQPDGSTNT